MRCYLIGGFLGSGKTTAIQEACKHFLHEKKRVGVITNDQGSMLVDSEILRVPGITQGQVVNGCFCCRYNDFKQVIDEMCLTEKPHYLFAEAVGSCADLVATIAKPLRQQGFQAEIVFSVFADAVLLQAVMGGNASFLNEDLRYIYRKQLEEADVILISKIDLLETEDASNLKAVIESEYAGKPVLVHSSYNADDMSAWLDCLQKFSVPEQRESLQIDYEIYARGELSLAWIDERIVLTSGDGSAKTAAYALTQLIYKKVMAASYPIGHLKFLLDDGISKEKISYTTINRRMPVIAAMEDATDFCSVLVNARLQAEPEQVDGVVREALAVLREHFTGHIKIEHTNFFKPGVPQPVWRL